MQKVNEVAKNTSNHQEIIKIQIKHIGHPSTHKKTQSNNSFSNHQEHIKVNQKQTGAQKKTPEAQSYIQICTKINKIAKQT